MTKTDPEGPKMRVRVTGYFDTRELPPGFADESRATGLSDEGQLMWERNELQNLDGLTFEREPFDIWEVTGSDLRGLLDELDVPPSMAAPIHTLRFANDEGELKVKVNEGMWSVGIGRKAS